MADIHLQCPHCKQHLKASTKIAGTGTKCPKCGRQLRVPSGRSSPAHKAREASRPRTTSQRGPCRAEDRPGGGGGDLLFLTCPKCGARNKAGRPRCANCKGVITPGLLSLVALTGTIFSCAVLTCLVLALVFLDDGRWWCYLLIPCCILTTSVFVALSFGRRWAWIGVQVVYGLGTLPAVFYVVHNVLLEASRDLASTVVICVGLLIQSLFWAYLYTEKVLEYCSA